MQLPSRCSSQRGFVSMMSAPGSRLQAPGKSTDQNVNLMPTCAAKGMPTVVPGPKKSPSAPAGKRNWLREVIGWVCVQEAFKQKAVALERLLTGVGKAARSGMKLLPGLFLLNRLKN